MPAPAAGGMSFCRTDENITNGPTARFRKANPGPKVVSNAYSSRHVSISTNGNARLFGILEAYMLWGEACIYSAAALFRWAKMPSKAPEVPRRKCGRPGTEHTYYSLGTFRVGNISKDEIWPERAHLRTWINKSTTLFVHNTIYHIADSSQIKHEPSVNYCVRKPVNNMHSNEDIYSSSTHKKLWSLLSKLWVDPAGPFTGVFARSATPGYPTWKNSRSSSLLQWPLLHTDQPCIHHFRRNTYT